MRSFLTYFNEEVTRIRLVDKTHSPLMKLANFGLRITNFLRITHIKDFMTDYGTTIGHTIYDHPKWDWNGPVTPHKIHELTHVLEWCFVYVVRYLFSAYWRAFYETVCIQSEWLIFPDNRTPDRLATRATSLVGYGIGLDVAFKMLKERGKEIDDGIPRKEALMMLKHHEEWESERGLR